MIEEGEHLTTVEESEEFIDYGDVHTNELHARFVTILLGAADFYPGDADDCAAALIEAGATFPMPVPNALTTDANEALYLAIQSAQDAQIALKDEHEGRFTKAVETLYAVALGLHGLVREW